VCDATGDDTCTFAWLKKPSDVISNYQKIINQFYGLQELTFIYYFPVNDLSLINDNLKTIQLMFNYWLQ